MESHGGREPWTPKEGETHEVPWWERPMETHGGIDSWTPRRERHMESHGGKDP